MTEREKLPPRRPSLTREVTWSNGSAEHRFAVSIGFCPKTGRALEVFANTKGGSGIEHVIADACVTVSIALQFGATPGELGKSLLRVPLPALGEDAEGPASPVGAIVEAVGSAEALIAAECSGAGGAT